MFGRSALWVSVSVFLLSASVECCISSAPRPAYAPTYSAANYAPPAVAAPRAAGVESAAVQQPIANAAVQSSLTSDVTLSEFGSQGYNDRGGGPVNEGASLKCSFDGQPCCWANVATPDDQIDWNVAYGPPDRIHNPNVTFDGQYLLAHASGAAPSDEAQLASCAIGCASSPIRVRARHWRKNVLLQVCLRESFPNSVNYNPLLNCQEFPPTDNGVAEYTELELPKAALVDVVFVASDFKADSVAALDDIQILYESDPQECESTQSPLQQPTSKTSAAPAIPSRPSHIDSIDAATNSGSVERSPSSAASAAASASLSGNEIVDGGESSAASLPNGVAARGAQTKHGKAIVSPDNVEEELKRSCPVAKCTFEDGNTCAYEDTHDSESIRGATSRFHVVKGQFMNRITGIKESPEGHYYAAAFIYPHEKAALSANVGYIDETRRIRFQFYESTHGIQLKGCCDSVDNCPFGTDRFVTVSDRMWKYGDFTCPRGTQKIIFYCENIRTNQGACALDDVQVLDSKAPGFEPMC